MADHPANIRSGPVDLTGLYAVDILHAELHGYGMAAVVAYNALRLASGAGGVQDVQRVRALHRDTVSGFGICQQPVPVKIAPVFKRGLQDIPLIDNHPLHLMLGFVQCRIDNLHIVDHPVDFLARAGGKDELGLGVINTDGKFMSRKAPEDHGVDSAQPRTGQHGYYGLRDHGHVDNDCIAFLYPLCFEHAGKSGHAVQQLRIGDGFFGIRYRRVIKNGRLIAPSVGYMVVERQVGSVQLAALVPAVEAVFVLEGNIGRFFKPVDGVRLSFPESRGVRHAVVVEFLISHNGFCLQGAQGLPKNRELASGEAIEMVS